MGEGRQQVQPHLHNPSGSQTPPRSLGPKPRAASDTGPLRFPQEFGNWRRKGAAGLNGSEWGRPISSRGKWDHRREPVLPKML